MVLRHAHRQDGPDAGLLNGPSPETAETPVHLRTGFLSRPRAAIMGGMSVSSSANRIRAGMVGLGMIFDETYRPLFEQLHAEGLYRRDFGPVAVELAAVASRTGARGERYRASAAGRVAPFANCSGPRAVEEMLAQGVDAVCVATPDDRHFE